VDRKSLIDETKTYEWSVLVERGMTYGLMGIAFGLFFVPLNHIVEYTFFGLLCFGIGWQWNNGTLQWIRTSLDWPIFFYVVWVFICVPWAVDPAYSFAEWRKAVAQMLMFYFVVHIVKTKEQIVSILFAVVMGVVVLSAIESLDFLWQGRSMWDMEYRAGDFTGSSQWFSLYLVMGFPILWISWYLERNAHVWQRILLGIGLGFWVLGLILVHTRGAWVAIAIQVLIYAHLKCRKNWWMAFGGAGLIVVVLLVILALPSVHHILSDLSSFTNTHSMQVRFNTWSLALQDIVENPLTGIGLGKHSFSKLHPGLQDQFHANLHNTFIARGVQIGIPGFFFYIWIFLGIVVKAASSYQSAPEGYNGMLALATALIVVGVIVRNLFDDMFNGTVAYLFWLLVGLFFSIENYEEYGRFDTS